MALLPDLPRVLTVHDARRLGLSRSAVRHRVASRGWQVMARGIVLTSPGDPTRDDRAQAGLALAGPDAALSGWDAARTRGLGARMPPDERVLILDSAGTNRRIGPVLIRPTSRPFRCSLLPAEHPTLPFVPVVDVPRAVADTALMHRLFMPVRAMVTSAVQRGLATPEQLVAELDAGPQTGSGWLRRALADVLDAAHSVAEAESSDLLRAARVPSYELNVPIVGRDGRVVAVADALWRRLRAVLEIDSREFHFTEDDWKATTRRHNRLTTLGLAVAHYPPSDVRARRGGWATEVAEWLRARADELGVPYVPGHGALRDPAPFIP